MSEEQQNQSANLLHNLGTDAADVAQGKTNMMRFGVIDHGDKAIIHYAKFRENESMFWKEFAKNELDMSVGVGGRGRRDSINGTQVERGNVADMRPEKPGPIDGFLHPEKKKAYEDWVKEMEEK